MNKLYDSNDGTVRALTFIKDTTISHVYPYKSNASVIGKNLALDYEQSQSVLFCKEKKIPVFDAPVNLIQGGKGMVSRIPILDNLNGYIGQLSIVFNFERSLEASGILDLSRENYITIMGMDPFTGNEKLIWSNNANEDHADEEKIRKELRLYDSNLYISAIPKEGWGGYSSLFMMIIFGGLIVASFSSLGLYKILSNREELQKRYSEILEQEKQILHIADHDPLTNLFNRRKLVENINNSIEKNNKGSIIFLDIDDFKNINDTLGHSYGDRLLPHFSKIMLNILKDKNMIYRLGGDEYYILLENKVLDEDVIQLIEEINSGIQENSCLEGIKNYVTTSIGVVKYPENGTNVYDLLMKVDLAMYSAKRAGKNQYKIFNDEIAMKFEEKVQMEKKLRTALENEDFFLVYQPIISAKTSKVEYFEALIRLKDKENNQVILPNNFIPIAESSGIIIPLGKWVILEVINQLNNIIKLGIKPKPIAVNLSPHQVRDKGLYEFLENEIKKKNIDPALIEIEITENVLLENKTANIEILQKIKSLGIKIALDDFGTGFSSLNYLPVDKIKFDKSLKDRIVYHENIKVMSGLIEFVHGFGLSIVAEGVEEKEEFIKLNAEGCDFFQGYLFDKPLEKEDMIKSYNQNYLKEIL